MCSSGFPVFKFSIYILFFLSMSAALMKGESVTLSFKPEDQQRWHWWKSNPRTSIRKEKELWRSNALVHLWINSSREPKRRRLGYERVHRMESFGSSDDEVRIRVWTPGGSKHGARTCISRSFGVAYLYSYPLRTYCSEYLKFEKLKRRLWGSNPRPRD